MTSNWKEYKLKDVCIKITDGVHNTVKDDIQGECYLLSCKNLKNNQIVISSQDRKISFETLQRLRQRTETQKGDVLLSSVGTIGETAIIKEFNPNYEFQRSVAILKPNTSMITSEYLFYFLNNSKRKLQHSAEGAVQQCLFINPLKEFKVNIPPLETQQKIAKVLSAIDDKIELNNSLNNNLEQQVQSIFVNMFATHINNIENEETKLLSELVQNIDNRGKTPPLSINKTNYPIIDVRALSGNTRIINYNNCTKYVEEETYNNWFRNGHPQKYDILLSTVGSLAEMKLFLGNIGCIAQNVIGYRCNISPLYLYQYLNYIKKDLLAYDIGSVQPSIKVTHIAKHPIFIPRQVELQQFHDISFAMTNEIYSNCLENERLTQLRDTLLPKLMSGEIDVDKVEV